MPPRSVSVIVRSCGRPRLLVRALASIDAQTAQPLETIVVALGPAGFAAAEAARPGRALTVIPTATDRVRGGALNDGLRVMTGSWVAILDDDDTWAPTFLQEMGDAAAAAAPAADFGGIVCRTEIIYERVRGGEVVEVGRKPMNPGFDAISARELAAENRFTINAALWHRRVFATAGEFREDLSLLEDWEFNVRVARHFRLEVLPRTLARYHRRPPGDSLPNTQRAENDRAARALQTAWEQDALIAPRPRNAAGLLAAWRRSVTQWAWRTGSAVRWWFR